MMKPHKVLATTLILATALTLAACQPSSGNTPATTPSIIESEPSSPSLHNNETQGENITSDQTRTPMPEDHPDYGWWSNFGDGEITMNAQGDIWLGDEQITFTRESEPTQSGQSYADNVKALQDMAVGDFRLETSSLGVAYRYTKNGEPSAGWNGSFEISLGTPQDQETVVNGESRYTRTFFIIYDRRQLQPAGERQVTIAYDYSPQFYMTPITVISSSGNSTTYGNGGVSGDMVGLTRQILERLSSDVDGKLLSEIFADFPWPDSTNMAITYE